MNHMDNADAARQLAQREHNWNQGPANTNSWNANARQAYETERARLQKQQEDSTTKKSW